MSKEIGSETVYNALDVLHSAFAQQYKVLWLCA